MRNFLGLLHGLMGNLKNLISGKSINVPSLSSMTLGLDDVAIAKTTLKNRQDWRDHRVVADYERKFAHWNGSRFAFAFMSGRVALSACLYALQLKKDDEVLLPGYTCVVVTNAISFSNLVPVYVDIELDTYGLDAKSIEKKITPKTKAIVLQHLFGLVCRDYEKIVAIAKNHGLSVIEDCAHSTGAEFKGSKIGNLGDLAFYSSEQSKVFNTVQGGIAVTNSPVLANKLDEYVKQCTIPNDAQISKQLRALLLNYYTHSSPINWKTPFAAFFYGANRIVTTTKSEELGIKPQHYEQRMPAAIARIGANQLLKIDDLNCKRRATAKVWDTWCELKGFRKPLVVKHSTPIYLRYPVLVTDDMKKDLSWAQEELNVLPGVWFLSNVHPAKIHVSDCPNADKAVRNCINFPCLGVTHEF